MPSPPPNAPADVLVAVLHFGDEAITRNCLESLDGAGDCDVLVIDNDPREVFQPQSRWAELVEVVRTGGGMGFAEAYNFGIRKARKATHQFFFLVNNDIIFTPESITEVRATFLDPAIGLVGPAVYYHHAPQALWACGGRISPWAVTIGGIREAPKYRVFEVDYIPAAALMTSAHLWDEIAGLSERFCFTFEEAEFALEVRKRGFKVVANSRATLLHEVGDSSNREPMFYYNTVRSRMRFGEVLFGTRLGALLGALSGLFRSYTFTRQRVFFRAVTEEIRGVPLTRATLEEIRHRFSKTSRGEFHQ